MLFSFPLQISELVSADIVAGLTKRSLNESDELRAVKLLAQENFDASSLSSDVKDIYYEVRMLRYYF